jgi:hypothetical protein
VVFHAGIFREVWKIGLLKPWNNGMMEKWNNGLAMSVGFMHSDI